jgi:gamma-glutamyl hercynylcysteine S-oxide synthase
VEMSVRNIESLKLDGRTATRSPKELRARAAAGLADARARTEWLLDRIDDERLHRQHNKLMSPLVWDEGHVGVYEELWLVMNLSGSEPMSEPRMHLYDAFENPRAVRGDLPLMRRDEVKEYCAKVRRRVLDLLDELDLASNDSLLHNGYVYDMVVQHENQHNETLLQALQLLPGGYLPDLPPSPSAGAVKLDQVPVPAGTYPIGTDTHEPYDNEHPRHMVELGEFAIDRYPVTCGQYREFMEAGGYERRDIWSDPGWKWREESSVTAPSYWRKDGETWVKDRFGHVVPVEWDHPVMHVNFHEAEAYCRWAGRRLPTEFEWEVAASWDPKPGTQRRYPWGDEEPGSDRANVGQTMFGTSPVGAYPAGVSAFGCAQMLGDVYEWTSSDFQGYPGFRSFPYKQYSEVFFGTDYKVLRGASWATCPQVARNSFRNWDYPIRRQIFSGFRTVSDDTTGEGRA